MATWDNASSFSTTSTTTGATWIDWNSNQNTSASASMALVWNKWTTSSGTTDSSGSIGYREPTAEEHEATRLANEERERQQKEAEARAEKILDENLNEEQRKVYAERKVVPITTAKGRKYLIKKGRTGNVYRLDEHGREVEKFCIHPDEMVPDQDTMLAQLLWLRWCEEEFLRIANVTKLAA